MTTKQMSYCSLEEAWGENYANLYKKNDNMLTAMPKENASFNDTLLKDRSLSLDKDIGDYYMNKKNELLKNTRLQTNIETFETNETSSKNKCDTFLDHYLNCRECKEKINKMLGSRTSVPLSYAHSVPSVPVQVENFMNYGSNNIDTLMLIFIGIVIILILHYKL